MPLNVHIHMEKDVKFLKHLYKNLLPQISISYIKEIPAIPRYDILVCGVPDKKIIEASPNLKHLIIPWAGLPIKTKELMLNYPEISVHNIHHNAVPTAEMAFSLMMTVIKNIIPIDKSFRKNDWNLRYDPPSMDILSGKKVLILGYGTIGKTVSGYCQAFGMKVTCVNSSGENKSEGKIQIYAISKLNELLQNADIIFLTLPLTSKTKGLIKKKQLTLLPDGATIINISRGMIIDERTLFDELKSGRINAGLDVWYNYPQSEDEYTNTPPSDFPFHELPNVVMTPHLAGHSDKTEKFRAIEVARLLNHKINGEPIPNRVDLDRGY